MDIEHRLTLALEEHALENSFSDSDTWGSWPNSPGQPPTLESGMDECLTRLWDKKKETPKVPSHPNSPGARKKRGRKPLRPNDPIKKKTEEKDKYWLRAFRAYMKERYSKISSEFTEEEKSFWIEHLGLEGKPDKGNRFLSYGRRYKNYLFNHQSFVTHFQDWFKNYGEEELAKKCKPESDLWFVFYDYGTKELLNYVPQASSSIDGRDSPLSCASPPGDLQDINDPIDFCMVGVDNDTFIESFLNQL